MFQKMCCLLTPFILLYLFLYLWQSKDQSNSETYYFKLYALDTEINLEAGITKRELMKAMEGHILVQGQLMGKYKR